MTIDYLSGLSIPTTLFFIFIVIVGDFFFMNLFVGVIIAKYNRENELAGKNHLLTETQRKWLQNRMNIIFSQPVYKMVMPSNQLRQPFFYIAESIFTQVFIIICILVNTIILSLQWYG